MLGLPALIAGAGALLVGRERGSTIPVPPPVRGGWLGTLFATFQLAVEVLWFLIRGLLHVVLELGQTGGRALTRLARIFFFGMLFLVLGGLVWWVAAALLGKAGP